MIEGTITLSLAKDHTVQRNNVTPLEAMLLVAEHHKNVGSCPVEVHKDTVKEIKVTRRETKAVKIGEKTEGDKKVDVMEERQVETIGTRSDNDEVSRLRGIYAAKKVQSVIASVRDLPATFEEALKLGIEVNIAPGGALSQTKLM